MEGGFSLLCVVCGFVSVVSRSFVRTVAGLMLSLQLLYRYPPFDFFPSCLVDNSILTFTKLVSFCVGTR